MPLACGCQTAYGGQFECRNCGWMCNSCFRTHKCKHLQKSAPKINNGCGHEGDGFRCCGVDRCVSCHKTHSCRIIDNEIPNPGCGHVGNGKECCGTIHCLSCHEIHKAVCQKLNPTAEVFYHPGCGHAGDGVFCCGTTRCSSCHENHRSTTCKLPAFIQPVVIPNPGCGHGGKGFICCGTTRCEQCHETHTTSVCKGSGIAPKEIFYNPGCGHSGNGVPCCGTMRCESCHENHKSWCLAKGRRYEDVFYNPGCGHPGTGNACCGTSRCIACHKIHQDNVCKGFGAIHRVEEITYNAGCGHSGSGISCCGVARCSSCHENHKSSCTRSIIRQEIVYNPGCGHPGHGIACCGTLRCDVCHEAHSQRCSKVKDKKEDLYFNPGCGHPGVGVACCGTTRCDPCHQNHKKFYCKQFSFEQQETYNPGCGHIRNGGSVCCKILRCPDCHETHLFFTHNEYIPRLSGENRTVSSLEDARIFWGSPFVFNDGYSTASRAYVRAMLRQNVHITVHPYYSMDLSQTHEAEELVGRSHGPSEMYDIAFIHWDYMSISREMYRLPKSKRRIAVSVWETTRINPFGAKIFSWFDEVWVPSEFSKKTLLDSGVTSKVFVIPHIVARKNYNKEFYNQHKKDKFTFYYIGTYIARKNIGMLVNSFKAEFQGEPNVRLLLKITLFEHNRARLEKEVLALASDSPEVTVIIDDLGTDQISSLHELGTCVVSATRGEGFGLVEAEAQAHGNRVISTGFGAFKELAREQDIQVPYRLVPVSGDHETLGFDYQFWAEPSEQDLRKAMRRAYIEKMPKQIIPNDRLSENRISLMIADKLKETLNIK